MDPRKPPAAQRHGATGTRYIVVDLELLLDGGDSWAGFRELGRGIECEGSWGICERVFDAGEPASFGEDAVCGVCGCCGGSFHECGCGGDSVLVGYESAWAGWCKFSSPKDEVMIVANPKVQNSARPALTRLVFLVTPIISLRNALSIAQIVIIYYDVNNWSRTTNQALAFLFIIFSEMSNLAILAIVLWGAWSFGRKEADRPTFVKEGRGRTSDSLYSQRMSQEPTV